MQCESLSRACLLSCEPVLEATGDVYFLVPNRFVLSVIW